MSAEHTVGSAEILSANVLIVDDQEANRLLLERMLREVGYSSVTITGDPFAVQGLHREHRYDLILLDLQMPGMDGFQVMDSLQEVETGGYLPVLVITAQPGHKLRALEAGAKDFISKPFERAEVLARVRNLLEVRLLHIATRRLYQDLVAEQKLALELGAIPGAMVGVVEEAERLTTPWSRSLKLRHPWLQLNLVTAFAAGGVVFLFQGVIDRVLILAMFLPVLAGQAGNTGSQTLAVTLRGLFLGEVQPGSERALVLKEALLGLLNGALVGLVAATAMYVVATVQHQPRAAVLSGIVLLAMTGSCLMSSSGALVPLTLRKLGTDPAVASSIFVTTATDMASMGLLLGLATMLV